MSTLRRVITVSTMALGLTAFANADQLIFSHVTASASAPFTDTFTLGGFQVGVGGVPLTAVLSGITISVTQTTQGEVDVFNTTGAIQSFTNGNASVPISVSGPGPTSINFSAVAGPLSGTVTAASASTAFKGAVGSSTVNTSVLAANFGLYTSGPTVSVSFSTGTGVFSGSAVPGVFFSGNAQSGGTTTITYNYTVPSGVPEPGTMLLLGSALLGAGLFGTKKFRK